MFLATIIAALVVGSLALSASDRSDCTDVKANGLGYTVASGRTQLLVGEGRRSVYAYCDQITNGGGWTVIQRRVNGALDFYKTWKEYENGFGDVANNHWLGLTYINSITKNKRYVLRIELTDWNDIKFYAEYDDFKVGGPGCNYTLESVGKFCGSCGDAMAVHVGMKFTTKDADNDLYGGNCATQYHGAWWYRACHDSNLNGPYLNSSTSAFGDGLNWAQCKGYLYSFKSTIMMIRPYNF